MGKFFEIFGPISGMFFGLILVVFREKMSLLISKTYESFPHDKNMAKEWNVSFKVRPIFVATIGSILIIFSLVGLVKGL